MRWYIMTSAATDAATRAFFEEKAYFGLQQSQIVFFQQVMPACMLGYNYMHATVAPALCPS